MFLLTRRRSSKSASLLLMFADAFSQHSRLRGFASNTSCFSFEGCACSSRSLPTSRPPVCPLSMLLGISTHQQLVMPNKQTTKCAPHHKHTAFVHPAFKLLGEPEPAGARQAVNGLSSRCLHAVTPLTGTHVSRLSGSARWPNQSATYRTAIQPSLSVQAAVVASSKLFLPETHSHQDYHVPLSTDRRGSFLK